MLYKTIIVVLLLVIMASLGFALFFMIKDKGKTKRMANALTLRIVLSIAVFLLLAIGFFTGLIQPHGIVPTPY